MENTIEKICGSLPQGWEMISSDITTNKPSTRIQEIKAQHGVSSMCIGCIFNGEEPWPDSVFGTKLLGNGPETIEFTRENHFPKENYVCKNIDSSKYGNCIIGDAGCEIGRYEP